MLKQLFVKYLRKILIFTVFVLVAQIVLRHFFPQIISPYASFLVLLFLTVTTVSHLFVLKTDAKRLEYTPDPSKTKEEQMRDLMKIERKFISNYFLSTTVKLLLFLVVLLLYMLLCKKNMMIFIVNFFVLYLVYSAFEIVVLKKPIKK
ncbi:MAG: hypothetical protein GX330_03645 [Bacteroidales bacterium]|nr:hypothetical protein [Bacteroidales bacterium]